LADGSRTPGIFGIPKPPGADADRPLEEETDTGMSQATIVPVAGGKGGVGKSILAANLAIALAETGAATIAVDMDLGASSLFAFLGLQNRFPGIGDFLRAKRGHLADLLVPSGIPNLQFLPGDGRSPFMANILHGQKKKLLRGLKSLEADYIVLDLGSGSTFNTLDFFSLGATGVVVTTPDYPSILKMLTFLKNFLLRRIDEELGGNHYARQFLKGLYDQPMESQISSMSTLYQRLDDEDPNAAEIVGRICNGFRPRIVFNMGSTLDDLSFSRQIDESLGAVLGIEADYFGFLMWDPAIRESIRARVPFLPNYPESPAAGELRRIAQRIRQYWTAAIPNSADLILARARKAAEERQAGAGASAPVAPESLL